MEVLLARRTRYPERVGAVLTLGAILALLACARGSAGQDPTVPQAVPHFDARTHTPEYVGPVDQRRETSEVSEIRIGYFGPADPQHPLYGNLWRAAQRAIEDANRRGGFEGKPYRLVPAWSDNPWGSGVKQITQLVYRDHVWAIVGGVDGPTTHLAEQVVVKARLALVSPVSTDRTVNLTNVPWMFSLAPNDRVIADVMVAEIARRARTHRFILCTTNDHDAFLLTRELRRSMTAAGIAPAFQFEYQPQSKALDELVQEGLRAQPDEIIIIANATESLQLVRAVRQAGFTGCIFGGPAFGREPFVGQIAEAAGEVVLPQLTGPRPAASREATDGPRATHPADVAPEDDYAALQVYDAVQLVTAAIEKAGLNRVAIGRAIRELSPRSGLSGPIEWDGPGSNVRRPVLATIVAGRIVPLDAENRD